MPTTEATLYEIRNGAAWITLNRPENRNALSSVLVSELYEHLLAANDDPAVRCIVITGADPAFCSVTTTCTQPRVMRISPTIHLSRRPIASRAESPKLPGRVATRRLREQRTCIVHICTDTMTGNELVRRVRRLGRERGIAVRFESRAGKGSHGRLYYGERFATVKDQRKEIGAGLLAAMLRQLGLRREDME